MPDYARQLLIDARTAHVERGYKACLAGAVQSARDAGWSLQEIGDVCGFTREYARQLDNVRVDERELVDFPHKPRRPRTGAPPRWTPPKVRVERALPPTQIAHLQGLYKQARTTNGGTPVGHPSRSAGDELWRMVNDLLTEERLTIPELATVLGCSAAAIRFSLGRRGYRPLPPSVQWPYKNKQTDYAGRRSATRTHCKRGHELTPENTGHQGAGRFCRKCKNERSLARYYANKEKKSA